MEEDSSELVTMVQALGICSARHYPLAESTWRKKVAEGDAPPVVHRRGRTPLWNREEVVTWAIEQAVGRQDLKQGTSGSTGQVEIHVPRLSSLHGVELDPMVLGLSALDDARERLTKKEQLFGHAVQVLERRTLAAQSQQTVVDGAEEQRRGLKRALTLAAEWYRRRQTVELVDAVDSELQSVRAAHAAATHDLALLNRTVDDVVAWAEREQRRRRNAAELTDLAEEEANRPTRLKRFVTGVYDSATFVLEEPSRLAWAYEIDDAQGRMVARDDALERLRAGIPVGLTLGGSDFGYNWRFSGADWLDEPITGAGWRVSWLSESTGEVYALQRPSFSRRQDPDPYEKLTVLCLGKLDYFRQWGDDSMPLANRVQEVENRQREPNSLALIAEAIADIRSDQHREEASDRT